MPIGWARNSPPPRVARVYKGKCGICYKDIFQGQAYDYRGGTNTSNKRIVHYNCYKPEGAPTWEELMLKRRQQKGIQ